MRDAFDENEIMPEDPDLMTAAESWLIYLAVTYASCDDGSPLTAKRAGEAVEHIIREWQKEAHAAQSMEHR